MSYCIDKLLGPFRLMSVTFVVTLACLKKSAEFYNEI